MTITKNYTAIGVSALLAVIVVMLLVGVAHAATISMQLDRGMTNSDVSALQSFLAADSSIYPEGLVTGYFGPLTEAAVMRYQTRNGIDAVGRVGPITLASINGTGVPVGGGTGGSNDVNAPFTSSVNTSVTSNSATITWSANEEVFGTVMYATSWPFLYATAQSVKSASGLSRSPTVSLTGLQAHTRYYFVLESIDIAGNLSYTIGNSLVTQ